jgi:multiple sugar transport system permease protein
VADTASAPLGVTDVPTGRRRSHNTGGDLFGRRGALGFLAPAAAVIAIFLIVPALWTLYLGLTDRNLFGAAARRPEFVGVENYRDALDDPKFWKSLRTTLIYVLGSALIGQAVL